MQKYEKINKLNINSPEAVKESLENLCLYLNEIERAINIDPRTIDREEHKYRLQVLEQQIADMGDLFKFIASEGKNGNITLS